MQYDLKSMLSLQKELNKKIRETQCIKYDEIKTQSHLSVLIELMELCNETRCFNYWSKKQRGSDEAVLEEFADVLCFILTEILSWDISTIEIDEQTPVEGKLELTKRFLNLAKAFANLDENNHLTYIQFMQDFFNLGYALGYNINKIYHAYELKVAKNHKVQDDFINNPVK